MFVQSNPAIKIEPPTASIDKIYHGRQPVLAVGVIKGQTSAGDMMLLKTDQNTTAISYNTSAPHSTNTTNAGLIARKNQALL